MDGLNYYQLMKKLDENLRKFPSTTEQTRYFQFTNRCKGYEFVHRTSGKVYTKLQLFSKFIKGDINSLNLLEEDQHNNYKKRLKLGWKEIVMPSGRTEAIFLKKRIR